MDQVKFRWVRKEILVQFVFFLGILRSTIIIGFRGVTCPSNWLTIMGDCNWIDVSFELLFWGLAVLLLVLELYWEKDWKGLLKACRANWLVFSFVGLAGVSLIWSLQRDVTLYKFVILLGTSVMAVYFGHVFSLEKLISSLTYFFLFISLISLLFVFLTPEFSIMPHPFYQGAWNGIFAHRNFLGVFMALGVVLSLLNLFTIKKPYKLYFGLNIVLLGLTSFLLFKSQSATGIISTLISVVMVLILYGWIRWGQSIKPWLYVGFFVGVLIAFILIMTNLNHFLGLFGRNVTFTGRVPVWQYLFQNVINQRPWLGYGYGVIWHLVGFVFELTDIFSWEVQVGLGDNGFIDIILHLGIVGFFFLIGLITTGFIRGVRYFLQKREIVSAFPILVLVFGVVANISLSLILEIETMVWMIAVACLVAIGSKASNDPDALKNEGKA